MGLFVFGVLVMERVNESDVDKQFADVLSDLLGQPVSLAFAKGAQDAYQKIIVDELAAGNSVSLHGFGKFELRKVPSQSGVAFGHPFENPAYNKVKFTAFGAVDVSVNPAVADDEPSIASGVGEADQAG